MEIKTTCEYCGIEFSYEKGPGPHRKYCSTSCRRASGTMGTYQRKPERFISRKYKGIVGTRYNRKCAICGWTAGETPFAPNGTTQHLNGNQIHHIVQVQDGGKTELDNLILLCPNHHKQADLGYFPADELRKYQRQDPTPEEIAEMKYRAHCRVVDAILPYIK